MQEGLISADFIHSADYINFPFGTLSGGILSNQKIINGLDSFSKQHLIF